VNEAVSEHALRELVRLTHPALVLTPGEGLAQEENVSHLSGE
jgi:hypothetical protein